MRSFKEFPADKICPVCKLNTNKECVLIAKADKIEGNIAEAQCYHLDCIQLFEHTKGEEIILVQRVN